MRVRSGIKRMLAAVPAGGEPSGSTLLIYHRIGGETGDELDMPLDAFVAQLDVLESARVDVVALDVALDRLESGSPEPSVVITFDDGFADVYGRAFPALLSRRLPFTVYVAAGLIGGQMTWEGSKASSQGAPALSWPQLFEMVDSGLCTVGNHTYQHATPDAVTAEDLDRCSELIERQIGKRPKHFAWTWGVEVDALLPAARERFRSAATGRLGRNGPGADLHSLARVPVRASDPLAFFGAKLHGDLRAERAYARLVATAKVLRRMARRE